MIHFENDYSEGACKEIMQRLFETNEEQTSGYGKDSYCENAKELIRKACKNDNTDVHFLVGGTQTNVTVISSILKSYQGVLCAQTGHINVHETGAVESTGHKVLTLTGEHGKITADEIKRSYEEHINNEAYEHIVQPKMVYISNPTELGTIYTKSELQEISSVCKECGLYLFLDGARLGYGLTAKGNDLSLSDIAHLTDVFYIGGTKVGALFGEAVVIMNDEIKKDFRYNIKQKGGMLAKGRLLGIQFETLFTNNLYFELARHANDMAQLLREAFMNCGFQFYVENNTNQIFVIMPDAILNKLTKSYCFSHEKRIDTTSYAVRFCTSFATKREHVERLIKDLQTISMGTE